jgi:hypothetical protein
MTRYRARAVLLLFLLLHLTACSTWQSANTPNPGGFIEATQPDRVRVLMQSGTQVELERPAVEGDQLVAPGGFSMPLADILRLEVQGISILRTIGFGYLAVFAGIMALIGIECLDECEGW